MGMWRVQLLGGFEVWRGQTPLAQRFETDSARALFAWLCLNAGKAARRDALAALLWPDKPQSAALSALRTTLARIRRALDDDGFILNADAHTVTLKLDETWQVDALRLDQAVAQARAHTHRRLSGCDPCLALLRASVPAYAGELLAGLSLESDLFLEWLTWQREHFHHLALDAFQTLGERALLEQDWASAAAWAERQLRLEAWREVAHRQKMLALARQGQRAAALAQYQTCRRILQQEFGAPPESETERLAEMIQRGALPALADAPGAAHHRAAALDRLPLIGRAQTLETLSELLNRSQTQLVSVIGEGGAGKTRLAIRAAQITRFAFEDGARFVFLHPEDPGARISPQTQPAEELAWRIADACQIALREGRSVESQVIAALKSRACLLVLDSFEHALDAIPFLNELLEAAPRCAALVTSRRPLHLRCEQILRLDTLGLERAEDQISPGAQMFVALASRSGAAPDAALDSPGARDDIEAICATLRGLPLSIELAAACLSQMSLPALRQAVQTSSDVPDNPLRDLPARHRSLRAVFESAWQMLSAGAQRGLAMLSVVQGPCPEPAAMALIGEAGALRELTNHSLVHPLGDGSVWMHEHVRRFAGDKLRAGPQGAAQAESAARRHAEWFLRWLTESHDLLRSEHGLPTRQLLSASFADLDAAWAWALTHGAWDWIANAAFACEDLNHLAGRLIRGLEQINVALDYATPEAGAAARRARARLLIARVSLQTLRGDAPELEAGLREAIALGEQIGDPALTTQAASRLGNYLRARGRLDEARQTLAQAALALERVPASHPEALRLQANWSRYRGVVDFRAGRWDEAESALRASLELATRLGDYLILPRAMESLSAILSARNQVAESEALLRRALEIYERMGLSHEKTNTLDLLAQHADARGDYGQAQRYYLQTIDIARAIGNRDAELVARINLGISCDQMGDYAQALAHTQSALTLCDEIGNPDHRITLLANLSLHAHHNDQQDTALRYAREAIQTAQAAQIPELEAYGHDFEGHALLALGEIDLAERTYQRALAIRERLGQATLAFETRAGLARTALARARLADAAAWVEPIAAHLLNGGNLDGAEETLRVYWTTYQVMAHNDDPRAESILRLGAQLVQERAARLSSEESQRAYLSVDAHRRVLQAWQAQLASSEDAIRLL